MIKAAEVWACEAAIHSGAPWEGLGNKAVNSTGGGGGGVQILERLIFYIVPLCLIHGGKWIF